MRTSIGTGFRVPSIAERFVDDTSFLPLASNVELRPETSLGLDAGLRFARGAWEAEATFFAARYMRLTEAVFVPAWCFSVSQCRFGAHNRNRKPHRLSQPKMGRLDRLPAHPHTRRRDRRAPSLSPGSPRTSPRWMEVESLGPRHLWPLPERTR